MDDLDRLSLMFVLNRAESNHVVDIGCGDAFQTLRFCLLQRKVFAYDIVRPENILSLVGSLSIAPRFKFNEADLAHLAVVEFPRRIDCIYSQRFIHYLRFQEAKKLLSRLFANTVRTGKIFISASGISSELSTGYFGLNHSLETRYANLSTHMEEKHGIFAPVCLYSEDDLLQLMSVSGFECERLWRSKFGNLKCVAVKK